MTDEMMSLRALIEKAPDADLDQEKLKQQTSLILEAVKTGDRDVATQNLIFSCARASSPIRMVASLL
jgi:hypothetical protein